MAMWSDRHQQMISETKHLLEPYPSKFLNNAMALVEGEACEQLLSDRLFSYDLDALDLRNRITQLLVDADGAVFLSMTEPAMPPDLNFRFYIGKSIGNVVCCFREVWTITNSILESLNHDTLPLRALGLLVFRLNALHDALGRVGFD
jgi:hypothetical protein